MRADHLITGDKDLLDEQPLISTGSAGSTRTYNPRVGINNRMRI